MSVKYCVCGSLTQVIDSRPTEEGYIKRRRVCPKCQIRFTTFEMSMYDMRRQTAKLEHYEKIKELVNTKLTKR